MLSFTWTNPIKNCMWPVNTCTYLHKLKHTGVCARMCVFYIHKNDLTLETGGVTGVGPGMTAVK